MAVILGTRQQHNPVEDYRQLPVVVPPGGDVKLFLEASKQVVNQASQYRIDGPAAYYNVYLGKDLSFQGFSPNCLDNADAYVRRKQCFMKGRGKVFWAVTFNRRTGEAVTECILGGFRYKFQAKAGPVEYRARPWVSRFIPKVPLRSLWNPRWSRNGFGANLSRAAVAARKDK